jgi:hypothetical protein
MPNTYYVRRRDVVHGPFTKQQIQDGVTAKKLDPAVDEYSATQTGPWRAVYAIEFEGSETNRDKVGPAPNQTQKPPKEFPEADKIYRDVTGQLETGHGIGWALSLILLCSGYFIGDVIGPALIACGWFVVSLMIYATTMLVVRLLAQQLRVSLYQARLLEELRQSSSGTNH